jgi:HK97 family phage portal protein
MNDWWTAGDVAYATEANLSLWGSAYWYVDKGSDRTDGGLASIWPLRPDKMIPIPDRGANSGSKPTQYIKGFKYRGEGGHDLVFLPEEIVWFRRFNPMNEYEGASPIAAGRASFDMGNSATMFNRNFFINDAMPSDLAITFKDVVSDEEYNEFIRRLNERHGGVKNANTPLIIDGSEADVKRLGITHRDMEFMDSLKWTVEDASRIWGVMPPLMMDREHTTLDNVRQSRIEFFSSTITFEWQFLEREINELLLGSIFPEYKNLRVVFDTTNVPTMQEARADTRKLLISEVEKGLLTINEYREAEGRDPVEWGDVWFAPTSTAPVSDGEVAEPVTAPTASPPSDDGKSFVSPWSEEFVDAYVKLADRSTSRDENSFLGAQKQLFNTQRLAVKKSLSAVAGVVRDTGSQIFDPADWVALYTSTGSRHIRDSYENAGKQLASEFELGPFSPDSRTQQEFVAERTRFWQQSVNTETAKQITAEMAAGIEAGESIGALQGRVDKVFGFADSVRSERVARTEVRAAQSAGQLGFIEQHGQIERKQWIAALDERTRGEHSSAHGQIRPKTDNFIVGGESLPAPGIGGSPWNVINCRCVVVPILVGQAGVRSPRTKETSK